MSTMNTLPQTPKSFDRFEGQDHGTRGNTRINTMKLGSRGLDMEIAEYEAEGTRAARARAGREVEAFEIEQGIRDLAETPMTLAEIDGAAWNDEYFKTLAEEWEDELEESIVHDQAKTINASFDQVFDNSFREDLIADEAYARNEAFDRVRDMPTPVTQEGTRRTRHRQAKRLGTFSLK